MRKTALLAYLIIVLLASCKGCVKQLALPPRNLADYERASQHPRESYPKQAIVAHNLQRVLDTDLPTAQRVESLELVGFLGGDAPSVRGHIAAILAEPQNPLELQEAVLEFLLKRDYPDLAAHVVKALPTLDARSPLRDAVLDWLVKHPQPEVQAEIVKLWAREKSPTGPNEPRFRNVIERMSRKRWDTALMDGLNKPSFFARGSAIEILAKRMPISILREKISGMTPKTDAVEALQAFLDYFDYMPSNGQELMNAVSLYKTHKGLMRDASILATNWQKNYGYKFNIRDFHLLSQLARDPLRTNFRRTQLILELGKAVNSRKHVRSARSARSPSEPSDNFWLQVESLTMGDLWNLYLLNEMLSRPRIQLALKVMSYRDRADTRSAWGGLVFYENGQAEAKLYPYSMKQGEDDSHYVPVRKAVLDLRNALCRFSGHFEKAENASRAGPDDIELANARKRNFCGLILTTVTEKTFSAHYYNPQGIIVSMGVFSFR